MSELRIRPASRGDAAALAHVQVASWRVSFHGLVPESYLGDVLDEDRRRHDWERLLERLGETHGCVLVGETDGVVTGFAHAGPSDEEDAGGGRQGELYALHVLPEARGGGLGQALLGAAVAELRRRGFAEATLWVLAANEPARRLYEADGWRPDGATKRFADQPEVRLRRSLAPAA